MGRSRVRPTPFQRNNGIQRVVHREQPEADHIEGTVARTPGTSDGPNQGVRIGPREVRQRRCVGSDTARDHTSGHSNATH